uniref:Uncharacterized protein n=1 Tax=viral metagenome TaxID=1070528 RepID=A0A6H1ZAF6_9ZZZZ
MSQEIAYLLRLQSPGTKELKVTAVEVFGSPTLFTSQLSSGYVRKGFLAYNNSASTSGEIVLGPSTVTEANGMIIPKGLAPVSLPVSTDIDVYFCNTVSGEIGNLRILEYA